MTNPAEISEHFLDIEKIIASKNPRLLKVIPGFIIRYLKRVIHQDELNGYIYRNRNKFGLEFVEAIIHELGVNTEIQIKTQLPNSQTPKLLNSPTHQLDTFLSPPHRTIIAANHPLGGLDGLALIHEVGKVRQDVVFPVNDLLMNLPGMKPLFIPVNKLGRNTENVAIIEETFVSEKVILYFPAGLVSRKQKGGIIRDLDWKKTIISKARKHQRDIIPCFITGRNSAFFYNLSNLRHRFGIKANIEMLYLVDEMAKQKDRTIRLIFGDPIPYVTFDRSKSDAEWAEWVKEKVYSLI